IGIHCGLDLSMPETPLDIRWIPPGPQQIRGMSVAEYVWSGAQASPDAQPAEKVDHRGVGHGSSDAPTPPVNENVVVRSLLIFVYEVVRIQFHQFFRDMHGVGRS